MEISSVLFSFLLCSFFSLFVLRSRFVRNFTTVVFAVASHTNFQRIFHKRETYMEMLQEHSPDTNTYASIARICIVPPRELIA